MTDTEINSNIITSDELEQIEAACNAASQSGLTKIWAPLCEMHKLITTSWMWINNKSKVDEGRDVLSALKGIAWKSADKDNMEFSARITCYQMDEILASIAKAEGKHND